MHVQTSSSDAPFALRTLASLIEQLAHLLPAQGPISIFIHHNPLHAFEHLPFEQAVERAAAQLGREPYLSARRLRAKLASGRIYARDVEQVLREHLGAYAEQEVAGLISRFELWRAVILHGIPAAAGRELGWMLEETQALVRFRKGAPLSALFAGEDVLGAELAAEREAVKSLWTGCIGAVQRTAETAARLSPAWVRHADWLRAVFGLDPDAWIHPPLIRFLAGYLDQGLAHWPMPGRELGIHGCFLELYGTRLAAWCGSWARALPRIVEEDRLHGRDEWGSLANSLQVLGVGESEWADYLRAELLALRGWAGIVGQIEERPDRVPVRELKVSLTGYLAVRLLLERAALEEAARRVAFAGSLAELRPWLAQQLRPSSPPAVAERAWRLFHLAQLCGWDASIVAAWTPDQVRQLEAELEEIGEQLPRRILHQAFERAIRNRFYDAISQHVPERAPTRPVFQAVFCIDEREESFRRHLEEVEPLCETFGTPGFFHVAMYYQGVSDAHPRPLCPVAIRPEHYVAEVEAGHHDPGRNGWRLRQRAVGFLGHNIYLGSRLPVRGALLTTLFGWLALIPLVFRVVFPWLSFRWRRAQEASFRPAQTRLQLERSPEVPPIGKYSGFTVPEMAGIVRRVLEDTGLRDRLAPLVFVVGHGSVSLNNPHESAHDCGACGGGRGGANARAFAQMANDTRVRELLAAEGLKIPPGTWFVGAERNTASNSVTFFDENLVPPERRALFERAKAAIEVVRRREAHERCRRFDAVPLWYPPAAALAHVEGRAADLAQPRPEYGHATNALCVIGRRARTRGLFLDRRAFLASYDPESDSDGSILARIISAVVPVAAGISLEYYFSYVDPTGYGCGTKLPHNVTALLGVMDGAQSDLRSGLPWQMVEIHEPVRLVIVVEAQRDRVLQAVRANPAVERLVRNRWVWLAALDPDSRGLWEWTERGFVRHVPKQGLPVVTGDSMRWYEGKRGFLPPVALGPGSRAMAEQSGMHVTAGS